MMRHVNWGVDSLDVVFQRVDWSNLLGQQRGKGLWNILKVQQTHIGFVARVLSIQDFVATEFVKTFFETTKQIGECFLAAV